MKYQLVHDGEVIRNANGGFEGAIEVEIDEDPTQPLGWAKSAAIHLDPDRDQLTVSVTLSGGGEKSFPLIIRRATRPGRDRPQLLLTLPQSDQPHLANGDIVIG